MMTNHLTKDEYDQIIKSIKKKYDSSDEYITSNVKSFDENVRLVNSDIFNTKYEGVESIKKMVKGWDFNNIFLRFGDVLKNSKKNKIDSNVLIHDFCEVISEKNYLYIPLYMNTTIPSEVRRKIFDHLWKNNPIKKDPYHMGRENEQRQAKQIYDDSKSSSDRNIRYMGERVFCAYGSKEDLRHAFTEIIQGRDTCENFGDLIKAYSHEEDVISIQNEFIEMFIRRDILGEEHVGHFLSGLNRIDNSLQNEVLHLESTNPKKYTAIINGICEHGSVGLIISAYEAGILKNLDEKKKKEIVEEVINENRRDDAFSLINSKLVIPEDIVRECLKKDPTLADNIFQKYLFGSGSSNEKIVFKEIFDAFVSKESIDFNIALIKYFPLIKEVFDGEKFIKDTEALLFDWELNISQILKLFIKTKAVDGFSFSDAFIEGLIERVRASENIEDQRYFIDFYISINNKGYSKNLVEKCNANVAREIFEKLIRKNGLDYLNAMYLAKCGNLYERGAIPNDIAEKLIEIGTINQHDLLDINEYEACYIRVIEKIKNAQPMESLRFMRILENFEYSWIKKNQLIDEKTLSVLFEDIVMQNQSKLWDQLEKFLVLISQDANMFSILEGKIFVACKGGIDDKIRYQLQKTLSGKMENKKVFNLIETYKDVQLKKIAAGEFTSTLFISEERAKENIGNASPESAEHIKEIWDFIKKQETEKSNFGFTIVSLLGVREYNELFTLDEYIEAIHKALVPYKKYISSWDREKIPRDIRATIGMEYEVTGSLRDAYEECTRRSISHDLSELNNFARIGKGNDAVYEIATQVADNPYCVLTQMQLLEDIGFLDFNFKKEGYKNGARGMHVTIGGSAGLKGTSNTHFLHNMLIASNWGGLNAGASVSGVARGRAYPIRERTHTLTPAIEMRSLSIDKKEPFERTLLAAHLGAIAIQAVEKYTTLDSELIAKEGNLFPKNKNELAVFLNEKALLKQEIPDEKTLSAIFAWCRLVIDVNESVALHNENFLEQETLGYLDESGAWVDATDFGGKENKKRFEGVAKSSGVSLEEYIEKSTKIPQKSLFKEADATFINTCTSIANLFIKPSTEMKGDKANASAVLAVTKINDQIEDDSSQNAEEFSFENKGIKRRGYYSFQGGSKDMVIHAIQRALLSFKERMENSFAFI